MGIAFVLTGFLIPQILVIAFRRQLFDSHDERKIHEGTVPRLGGIAFVPAIIFSVLFIIGLDVLMGNDTMTDVLEGGFVAILFLICSLMLLFLVGIADDLIGVRYSAKFLFQIISACLTIGAGLWISNLWGFLGLNVIPVWLGWGLTGLLVVYVVNALNLIDGIDGLAAGLAAVALFFYGVILYYTGNYIVSMLAWGGFGSLIPFMYFNIFGNADRRQKIFMGDTGSLTIGMLIAFIMVKVWSLPERPVLLQDSFNPLILVISPMLIPLLDVARVFWHRIKRHRNPFMPDRTHIHHKLLALGISPRAALACILSSAIVWLILNVWLSSFINPNWIILADIVIWIILNLWITSKIRCREKLLSCQLYD